MIIALDIETIPNADMFSRLPEPEVAIGNLVDPAKIAAKKAAVKVKQIADMALDPLWAMYEICPARSGTFWSRIGPSARIDAAMIGSAAFLAPLTRTRPSNFCPPVTTIASIVYPLLMSQPARGASRTEMFHVSEHPSADWKRQKRNPQISQITQIKSHDTKKDGLLLK